MDFKHILIKRLIHLVISLLLVHPFILTNVSRAQDPNATLPPKQKKLPKIELVRISPGRFTMGSDSGDEGEKPVRRVSVTKEFYMSKYEITQGQWRAIMGTTIRQQREKGSTAMNLELPPVGEGDLVPMYYINWYEAQQFILKLNALSNDGFNYRLPTEAEWEYACRAGTTGDYHGEDVNDIAWFKGNSENKMHRVGTKQPNAFGLYDMSGNVWEWCSDWYGDYERGPARDPSGPSSQVGFGGKVIRGGSMDDEVTELRSWARSDFPPQDRSFVGFRVVAVKDPKGKK